MFFPSFWSALRIGDASPADHPGPPADTLSMMLNFVAAERDLLASVIDAAGALILMLDAAGRIVRFNRASERLTGYEHSEALGRTVWDFLVPASERDDVRAEFERLISDRRPQEHDGRWISKEGDIHLISWSHSALVDAQNEVEFVVSVGQDVTRRTELERRIVDDGENERRRIGHDLHERLGNHLAGTALLAEAATTGLRSGGAVGATELEHIADLLNEGVDHARALSRALGPVKIEHEGLLAALSELVHDVETRSGMSCALSASDDLPELTLTSAAVHVFRIVQEALTNARTHSDASRLDVEVSTVGESLVLSVRDDGIGIPDEFPANRLGIHRMRYRARLLGGTISIERRKIAGTEVRCVVPLSQSAFSPLSG